MTGTGKVWINVEDMEPDIGLQVSFYSRTLDENIHRSG